MTIMASLYLNSLSFITHTHTQLEKRLDGSQLFSRWPVDSAISHHSNMPSFSLSPSLILSFSLFSPIRSAKRRKMADKILPQRVRSITKSLICLSLFVHACVYLTCVWLHGAGNCAGAGGQKVKGGSAGQSERSDVFEVVKGVDSQGVCCRVLAWRRGTCGGTWLIW